MNDRIKKDLRIFKEGIIDNNPVLVQLLGTCPTLATTTSVSNAVGMGLAATVVLVFSNLFISLLRKFIPKQVRIAAYIVIISGFVTAVEMLIKAFLPALDASLGVFIPLIVVNCIILARAEAFASKNPPLPSVIDGLGMGIGFTAALIVIASVREVLGAGTFLGYPVFGEAFQPVLLMVMAPGAFITLGVIIAVVQKVRATVNSVKQRKESGKAVEIPKIEPHDDIGEPVSSVPSISQEEFESAATPMAFDLNESAEVFEAEEPAESDVSKTEPKKEEPVSENEEVPDSAEKAASDESKQPETDNIAETEEKSE